MITLFALLQKSYATGWLVAAPIGPVNLEIIRRGLRQGLLSGFLVGLGACCVDATYLSVFSLGLGAVLTVPAVRTAAFLLGGVFLCWIGGSALSEAQRQWRHRRDPPAEVTAASGEDSGMRRFARSPLGSYVVGVGMTATNPMTIAFWSALALEFVNLPVGYRLVATAGVLTGALSWVLLLSALLGWARRWVGPGLFAFVNLAGGSVVVYFGLRFLWRGLAVERWMVSWLS